MHRLGISDFKAFISEPAFGVVPEMDAETYGRFLAWKKARDRKARLTLTPGQKAAYGRLKSCP